MFRINTLILAVLATLLSQQIASAQVWVDVQQLDGKLPDWVDPQYVRPSPRPPTVEYRRIWVEPVYRVTCRRVWTERVVRVEYERVWVAPRYEMHDLVCWENGVQIIRRERVCVEPGHWDMQRREVVVSPGGWQTIEDRDLVSGGYWKLERT